MTTAPERPDTRIAELIRAGHSDKSIYRLTNCSSRTPGRIRAKLGIPSPHATAPAPTLADAWWDRTEPVPGDGGHLRWTGSRNSRGVSFRYRGQQYSALRVAFTIKHDGREPRGRCEVACDYDGCVAHVTDQVMRDEAAAASLASRNELAAQLATLGPRAGAVDWARRGLCGKDEKPNRWFPKTLGNEDEQTAKEICRRCPVQLLCLRDALDEEAGEPVSGRHGIRGGLNHEERDALARPTPNGGQS